tara:strand:+ start:780 stop:2135 length:1356 start_codon:yes stop_codon:yes gene_type:complete
MNDMKKVGNYGIKWGPFTLKIPFIHIKFLTAEFLQGMVISGATAFAGAPVVMALGLSFEEAVACCFIASTLITAGPIIFGEPFAPGWVTPALPLVIAFFMSKGFFDGTYRVETFHYMAAMCIEFTAIILLLGMTGLGRVITEKIPNALKSGIILGAALAAFHQIFFSDYERYIGDAPISMILALVICSVTTFSEPFKRMAAKNKVLQIIGSLGLLPGFIVAAIVGYLFGEINFDIQSGFAVPPIIDVYNKTSPLSIGFPPIEYFTEVFPLVVIGYLLLFGDFVTGTEILKDGQSYRPDEEINIDINRAHNSVGIRNFFGTILNPFFPTQGALWTGVHVIVVERWKQGSSVMRSLFDGIGSYYLMGIPFLYFTLPFVTFMQPLMILALGVTLVLTGLACAYVAMSMVKKNSEMAVTLVTAVLIAFGGEYMWLGILIGLLLSILLVDKETEAA